MHIEKLLHCPCITYHEILHYKNPQATDIETVSNHKQSHGLDGLDNPLPFSALLDSTGEANLMFRSGTHGAGSLLKSFDGLRMGLDLRSSGRRTGGEGWRGDSRPRCRPSCRWMTGWRRESRSRCRGIGRCRRGELLGLGRARRRRDSIGLECWSGSRYRRSSLTRWKLRLLCLLRRRLVDLLRLFMGHCADSRGSYCACTGSDRCGGYSRPEVRVHCTVHFAPLHGRHAACIGSVGWVPMFVPEDSVASSGGGDGPVQLSETSTALGIVAGVL